MIDFNLYGELSQAETKSGRKRFNVTYSKATYNWSAKPIKEKKYRSVFKNLVSREDEVVANGVHLPKPMLPILPKTIASVENPVNLRLMLIKGHVLVICQGYMFLLYNNSREKINSCNYDFLIFFPFTKWYMENFL